MNQQQQEIAELKEEIARLKEIVEPDGNVVNNYNLTRSERLSNFLLNDGNYLHTQCISSFFPSYIYM